MVKQSKQKGKATTTCSRTFALFLYILTAPVIITGNYSCINVKVTPHHALSTSDEEEMQTNIVLVWVPITLHGFYSFKYAVISFFVLILDNSLLTLFIFTKTHKNQTI